MRIIRIFVTITAFALAGDLSAQTLTNLYQFGGSFTNGRDSFAGLVQGSDGNFYGTTLAGGTNNIITSFGDGTVFKISAAGVFTTLYQFGGLASDGQGPQAALIQGNDGNFYGTTWGGGTHGTYGTVFKITAAGALTTLYQFDPGTTTEGTNPQAGLVQGSDGYFYGTTAEGGTNNYGTVFKITSAGTLTTLCQFGDSPTNGKFPLAGLVQGGDGNFYGTTNNGGKNNRGTVFKITSAGTLTTLYQFGGVANDGSNPQAGLIYDNDGNFYGTTYGGGTNNIASGGDGTLFKITSAGTLTTLYQFGGMANDGMIPEAGLVQGSDGNFYGTTYRGGTNNIASGGDGTLFKITSAGTLTTLYQFGGVANDGLQPYGGLVQGSDGNFCGTTAFGGNSGNGTVFKFCVTLIPPANQISAIQRAGTNAIVSLPSVAGETYQLQFSPAMNPTNWSNVSSAFVSNSIGALLTLTNFGGAMGPQGFYRFDITP